jgi:hypothetical protein
MIKQVASAFFNKLVALSKLKFAQIMASDFKCCAKQNSHG